MRVALILLLASLFSSPDAEARKVRITSTPSGAEVIVDGRSMGTTPLDTSRAELMPHWMMDGVITKAVIRIELPMHVPQTVTVSEFRTQREIHVDLQRDHAAVHFENYLNDIPGLTEMTEAAERAVLYVSEDLDSDSRLLESRGYVMVAYFGASAAVIPVDIVREHATEVGGAVILMKSSDDGVQTELRAVISRTTGGVSTSFGRGSTYGSGTANISTPTGVSQANTFGSSHHSGSSVTFVPGQATTNWVPYSTRRYATQATIWRKRAGNLLGAILDVVPEQIRASIQRNTGAFVVSIEDDSPAFLADMLVGDVIVEAGGKAVRRPADIIEIAEQFRGRSLQVTVLRNGQPMGLDVVLE